MHERRMTWLYLLATGYCVSTVGLDEDRICRYIREQEEIENRQGDMDLKEIGPLGGAFLNPRPMGVVD